MSLLDRRDGMGIRPGVTLAVFLTLFIPSIVFASSEFEYSKGVIAFSKGDMLEARKHFEAVVAQDPSNVQANYYLGQVALSSGRYNRAVELFRKVLKLDPSNSSVRLDLALALIKQKKFNSAEKELQSIRGKFAKRASVLYYLGYCKYKQGKHQDAIVFLRKAQELGGGFSVSAGYYLGMANLELGKRKQALRAFRQIAEADAGTVGIMARENLRILSQPGSVKPGRWGMIVSAGAGYDTNVTLETDSSKGSAAPTTFVAFAAWGAPVATQKHELDLALSIYRSFNFDMDRQSGSAPKPSYLDLTDVAFVLGYKHMLRGGDRWDLAYLLDLDMLDDLGRVTGVSADKGFGIFMLGNTARARYRLSQGGHWASSIEYRFHWRLFYEPIFADQDRDNFGHEVLLRQEMAVFSERLKLELALGAVFEDAKGTAWNIWGLNAWAKAGVEIIGPLTAWTKIGWQRSDHFSSENSTYNGHRVDDLFSAGAGLYWRLSSWLSVAASWSFWYNDSNGLMNSPFRYQRNVFQFSVSGRL